MEFFSHINESCFWSEIIRDVLEEAFSTLGIKMALGVAAAAAVDGSPDDVGLFKTRATTIKNTRTVTHTARLTMELETCIAKRCKIKLTC